VQITKDDKRKANSIDQAKTSLLLLLLLLKMMMARKRRRRL